MSHNIVGNAGNERSKQGESHNLVEIIANGRQAKAERQCRRSGVDKRLGCQGEGGGQPKTDRGSK